MSAVFVILFLAAAVGVFKPYIKGLKRSYFAIAAVVALILVGITAPPTTPGTGGKAVASGTGPAASGLNTAASEVSGASSDTAFKWEYQNDKDQMRGTSTQLAQVTSDNTVDLDFPYGEVHGQLWLRRRAEDGLNVAFEAEKGQVLCHSFGNSYVSIKFDEGPIRKFRCTGSSDGSSNVAFLNDARGVLAGLKRSKRAVVEAEFFQGGRYLAGFQ